MGLTEAAAQARGREIRVGRQEFAGVARARATGQTRGFIKLVADADSRRLLGGHILGPSAGELIHEITLAISWKRPWTTWLTCSTCTRPWLKP